MKKLIIMAFMAVCGFVFCQEMVVSREYGSKDDFVNQLMDFQEIAVEGLTFKSKDLLGKFPIVRIREFKDGVQIKTDTLLFPEKYTKIGTEEYSLRFFSRLDSENNKLYTFIRGKSFSSGKKTFALQPDKLGYAWKDLFGSEDKISLDLSAENTVFLITTPHYVGDGFYSYCEIAQSEVVPEDLGKHFQVPHYFLISIQFLDTPKKYVE